MVQTFLSGRSVGKEIEIAINQQKFIEGNGNCLNCLPDRWGSYQKIANETFPLIADIVKFLVGKIQTDSLHIINYLAFVIVCECDAFRIF